MSPYVTVAATEELAEGKVMVVRPEGHRIALCNVGGAFYAIDDVCTHDGGALDQGELDGTAIECPRHGGRFDVTTGQVLALPPVRPVRTYAVRVENGAIAVEIG
ncbi:MAG: non-heme iron oxygenase ferredoxin subunit [Dehalococcoidia bacterium]|nr:non-heme iron oxygenase ferredoxin subunit [Dehalococcoidia bacterium]